MFSTRLHRGIQLIWDPDEERLAAAVVFLGSCSGSLREVSNMATGCWPKQERSRSNPKKLWSTTPNCNHNWEGFVTHCYNRKNVSFEPSPTIIHIIAREQTLTQHRSTRSSACTSMNLHQLFILCSVEFPHFISVSWGCNQGIQIPLPVLVAQRQTVCLLCGIMQT